MTRKTKKLSLSKDTVKNLDSGQLNEVIGGGRGGRNPCTDATPVTCIKYPPTFVGDTCNCSVFAPGCDSPQPGLGLLNG